MKWKLLLVFALLSASPLAAQERSSRVVPPKLVNRTEIIAERERIAKTLLQPGDSLLIMVYAYVDETGVTRQPDVKVSSKNAAADTAAMMLVKKMRWIPPQGTGRGAMMSIPVKLVRK